MASTGAFAVELVTDHAVTSGFSKTDTAKVSGNLLAIYGEYRQFLGRQPAGAVKAPAFVSRDKAAGVVANAVAIDAAASGDPQALAKDLRKLGARDVVVFGRMVSCHLPLASIAALKQLSTLHLARPAYMHTQVGSVTSQGDVAMRSDVARSAFNVDGTGVTVGTLSNSYDCLGTAAAGVASGDLPANVTVLAEGTCPASDEGRAMMEIVHDVAPGATLSFNTAGPGEAGFAAGIIALADNGAKVISDDVSFSSEPFYQDGLIAQAVDTVKARGVAYFTSSGNAARKAYESPFRPSGQFVDLGFGAEEAHNFESGANVSICQHVSIAMGDSITLSYQWDEPFFSVSGAAGSASDMDIILTDAACDTAHPLASSADPNVGGDPLELLSYTNAGPATSFGIVLLHSAGPNPGLMKVIDTAESIVFDTFATNSGSSYGHPLARGGIGVAAAYYADTPEFGTAPPVAEDSSSAGGGSILFDVAGNRLATADQRMQPAVTGPDGVDTSYFGGSDPDSTGFPNFFGTSAAAPHAAAVAALIVEHSPLLRPDSIYAAMKQTAIDMDDAGSPGFDTGFDFKTGFGLIQADAALTFGADIVFANGFE